MCKIKPHMVRASRRLIFEEEKYFAIDKHDKTSDSHEKLLKTRMTTSIKVKLRKPEGQI